MDVYAGLGPLEVEHAHVGDGLARPVDQHQMFDQPRVLAEVLRTKATQCHQVADVQEMVS